MPYIFLVPLGVRIIAREDETVFAAIRRHGYPLASSCGGDGVCDKCRIRILSGAGHLTELNNTEERFRRERSFASNERMACQVYARGDIAVSTTYW